MPLATPGVDIAVPASSAWTGLVKDANGNPVLQIDQTQTEWCWAACAQMVLQFYGTAVQQCDLASDMFGQPDCCTDPSSQYCNVAAQVDRIAEIYTSRGLGANEAQGSVLFAALQDEINANRPVEVAFTWGSEGHQAIVCGWRIDAYGPCLLVNDPKYGSGAVYYVNLCSAYGLGSWDWTWTSIG